MNKQLALRAFAMMLGLNPTRRSSHGTNQTSEAEYRQIRPPKCPTGYGGQEGKFLRTTYINGRRVGVYLTSVKVSWTGRTHVMEHFYERRRGRWVKAAKAHRIA